MKATSLIITPADPSVDVGESLTLTASTFPAGAPQAVIWISADPTKATIDPFTGAATGIALGSVAVTAAATDGSGITATATLIVNDAVITLGDERFIVAVPVAGGTATLANAPSAVASDITKVKVNIAAPANAAIKIGNTAFTQGQTVDFSAPVTFTVTAQDGTVKSYTINIPAYDAISNPYGIYTVKHLVDVANELTASYLLKNNIDLPNADAAGVAATGISDYAKAGWEPLTAFTGTFDGGNFSINNFYAKREKEKVGLFGELGEAGAIKNLGVNGIISGEAVTGSGSTLRGGNQYTGILAGHSSGTIDRCYATGNVSSSSDSYDANAGGLAGGNTGRISNSYATGSVSSDSYFSSSYAGGLAGSNHGTISHSYATGSVSSSFFTEEAEENTGHISNGCATGSISSDSSAGGLVGSNHGTISNSYATGGISSFGYSDYSSAGGLAGSNHGRISNSYATGSVSSESSKSSERFQYAEYFLAGGLAGENMGIISHCYATGNVSSSSSDSYACAGGVAGSNWRDGRISHSYAAGNVSSSCYYDYYYPSSYESYAYAGGLAGRNDGSISHSYAAGNVSSDSHDSYANAGGLAGWSHGSISHSYATGNVSSVSSDCVSAHVGGLAGSNWGDGRISHSYAAGSISSSYDDYGAYLEGLGSNGEDSITHGCAADLEGLVVWAAKDDRYTNCYCNSNVAITEDNQALASDDASAAGITPKTKAYMQTDAFLENLNGRTSVTVWGRDDAKNDKLPYIIGLGAGK